jgi:hypothetical protein
MRIRIALPLVLSLLAVPAAARADDPAPAPPPAPAVVQPVEAPTVPASEMKLKEVRVQADRHADDAVVQGPARGSFWWLVGVIVVAGVILAVVL